MTNMKSLPPIDYSARVAAARQLLGNAAMLLQPVPEAVRNSDVFHNFRQDSLIHYLTGFSEPDCALLILGTKVQGAGAVLFLREKDKLAELWTGFRLGVEAAAEELAVDEAYPTAELWERLPELLRPCERLYTHLGRDPQKDIQLIAALGKHRRSKGRTKVGMLPVFDAELISGQLRMRKSPGEIARMRHAASITTKGFSAVSAALKPGMNERDIHGILVGEYLKGGAEMEAYSAIVAGGANACCLHYHANDCELRDGELLLIDSGCQFDYYASDVTRTLSIGKRFSGEQKAIYEIVLNAQLKAIDACRVGSTLKNVHATALNAMVEGLLELKLLSGSVEEILEKKTYKDLCPHNTSHWIGMDVHDVGDYEDENGPLNFKPGMAFTVEPGIYVQDYNESVPACYRGIGVRIEDDIVITDDGPEILTSAIPKSVDAMEGRG